jgi:hypothetical protein
VAKNEVPVVIYTKDGGREVIGKAEVEMTGDGIFCAMVIDEDLNGILAVKSPLERRYLHAPLTTKPTAPGLDNAAFSVDVEQTILEIDRCARAYGWEIGNGQYMMHKIVAVTPGNPFLLPNWRDMVKDHDHKPIQHRDNKPPWCNACGQP